MSENTKPTQYTEQERVQILQSWRNRDNSRYIDEAIASGESPEDAALRILNASMKRQETANDMVAYAREIGARRKKQ
ncbi:hypothetical protein BK138_08515 [Paenibacillus rhizosphaerae]|uniref:Uncharacterized protein n=1 Tax=Paenibacillus rhizosphaerae TaxID=297318 RepID=A0A1R1F363_9BACL|nr:hypothetical protein [Paenibacillus rhizosphaerae]OMF58544.1 hypothetical protein BK138_08515 [Paenibacillus rhizosphaerae]